MHDTQRRLVAEAKQPSVHSYWLMWLRDFVSTFHSSCRLCEWLGSKRCSLNLSATQRTKHKSVKRLRIQLFPMHELCASPWKVELELRSSVCAGTTMDAWQVQPCATPTFGSKFTRGASTTRILSMSRDMSRYHFVLMCMDSIESSNLDHFQHCPNKIQKASALLQSQMSKKLPTPTAFSTRLEAAKVQALLCSVTKDC